MPVAKNEFYECDNPECNLRFPGYDGPPRWNRCPACRSSIHVVATFENISGKETRKVLQQGWQIEAMLDNIRSAGNVGSIFRTSDGTGIQKLYLCGITPSPENSKVTKTALGAEVCIPWEKYKNGFHLARSLKSKGYVLWVLEDLPEAVPLFKMELNAEKSPIVLVIGNEVSGVDPSIIEICDKVISIPMLGKKQSYNVAVAFGIAASFLVYLQSEFQGSRNIFPNT